MRAFLTLLTALALFFAAAQTVGAETTLDGYDEFVSSLPPGVAEKLPTGDDVIEDADGISSWEFLLGALGAFLGDGLKNALPLLCRLLGLLLISAVAAAASSSFDGRTAELLSMISSCGVCSAVIFFQLDSLLAVSTYLSDLTTLVNGMTPVVLTLYASGGNVAGASVSTGAMTVFLALCENLLGKTLLPFVGCCLCLSAAASSGMELSGLLSLIKKWYASALCFIMSLLCAILAGQSAIAAGQDGISLRAAKFVAGSSIPIVGGSVGESMKTLSASVSLLRKCFGVTGVVLIALLTLPTLISLLLTRAVFGICASLAELLRAEREKRLLNELSGIYGSLAAVVSACSLMFVFLLTLLSKSATALL